MPEVNRETRQYARAVLDEWEELCDRSEEDEYIDTGDLLDISTNLANIVRNLLGDE